MQSFILACLFFLLVGCGSGPNRFAISADVPTPPSNLPDVVRNLSDRDPTTRLVSIEALKKYGDAGVVAIPKLIENLYYRDSIDVQMYSAEALGRFGPQAKTAVKDLGIVLQDPGSAYHLKTQICVSLGEIGDRAAVPALANALNQDNTRPYGIAAVCADALAKITREPFRDANTGTGAYLTDKAGIPFVVIDARKWWTDEGQFQDWSK